MNYFVISNLLIFSFVFHYQCVKSSSSSPSFPVMRCFTSNHSLCHFQTLFCFTPKHSLCHFQSFVVLFPAMRCFTCVTFKHVLFRFQSFGDSKVRSCPSIAGCPNLCHDEDYEEAKSCLSTTDQPWRSERCPGGCDWNNTLAGCNGQCRYERGHEDWSTDWMHMCSPCFDWWQARKGDEMMIDTHSSWSKPVFK